MVGSLKKRPEKPMKQSFEYRSYAISAEDGRYTAKSLDGEPCDLRSNYLLRVLRAVDTLWAAIETAAIPVWFADWMKDPVEVIDLDAAADAAALPVQCSNDNVDEIFSLKFPRKAIALANRVAAASVASVFALSEMATTAAAPIMELGLV
jgi:hypothetical protein